MRCCAITSVLCWIRLTAPVDLVHRTQQNGALTVAPQPEHQNCGAEIPQDRTHLGHAADADRLECRSMTHAIFRWFDAVVAGRKPSIAQ